MEAGGIIRSLTIRISTTDFLPEHIEKELIAMVDETLGPMFEVYKSHLELMDGRMEVTINLDEDA